VDARHKAGHNVESVVLYLNRQISA
jgi:hypothetical protein